MIVRRAVGEAPSVMKWLMFTVGRRNGFQTARSSHFANISLASRRKASWLVAEGAHALLDVRR